MVFDMPPRILLLCITAIAAQLFAAPALACACCSSEGSRYVAVEKLDARRIAEIERMSFAKSARIASGEADVEIRGIAAPETNYQLAVTREKGRFVFGFRDSKGRTGTLALALPRTISIFEVDPRQDEQEGGLGPVLYKEWKLTAPAAGGGLFGGIAGKGQKLTLVLHGHGRGCTDASHFTAWTLLIHGRDRLTLTGTLER
jgi:hypothetical protein